MLTPREVAQTVKMMEGARKGREAQFLKLSRWVCPWRGRLPGQTQTDLYERDNAEGFTSITADAIIRGASGMTSGMTPRSISWFKPTFLEQELLEATGAREWLDIMDRRMKETLAGGGFYQAIQNFNCDLLWAGAGMLYCESGQRNIMDFYCVQPGAYLAQTNSKGWLEAAARLISISVTEAASRFGEGNLSQTSRTLLKKNPYQQISIWHVAIPLDKPQAGHEVASYYIEERARDKFLHTGLFHEMPYFYTVWNEGATPYGTGPGDNILADAMQIDMLERNKLAGLAKLVDPPVAAPSSLRDNLDLSPGAINFVNENQAIRPILDLTPYAKALDNLQQEIQIVAGRIEKGLMASVFSSMPLDQRPAGMSATEFLERKRDALQQLGPIMNAYEPQVLTPLLVRVANTLQREGYAPPEPDSLKDVDAFMKMDFISPTANALRQTGAESTRALVADISQMAQATQSPDILDKINMDQIVDELATGLGPWQYYSQ